jgi:branched-chain amino acid transport system ATP-binding protein
VSGLLEVSGLRAGYDGGTVLRGVDLRVDEGEALAVLGRNGAGKSTLVNAMMGLLRPYAGSVLFAGRQLAGQRPDVVARAGIGLVPQGRRVFAPLTVEENLTIAARGHDGAWNVPRVYEFMPALARRRKNRGDQLSGGEQQMLAIARAVMRGPRLLLLDEPSDGLAPIVVEQVTDLIATLRDEGMAVLIVEQNLHAALRLADRVAVVERGAIALDTSPADFRSDRERAHRLLGVG